MPVFLLRKRESDPIISKQQKPQIDISMTNTAANLAELPTGQSARVSKLRGSPALMGRLRSMGILPGTVIVKKSAIPAKGQIVVEKGSTQFAIGYHMAESILVELIENKE